MTRDDMQRKPDSGRASASGSHGGSPSGPYGQSPSQSGSGSVLPPETIALGSASPQPRHDSSAPSTGGHAGAGAPNTGIPGTGAPGTGAPGTGAPGLGSSGPGTGGAPSSASAPGAEGHCSLNVGDIFGGRYRILRRLGEGGMGEVFAAEHMHIKKRVAIKVLRPEIVSNAEAVARFEQEAYSASSIGHRNIINIDDFGTLPDGRIFLFMELLDGKPLNEMLREQLSPECILDILIQTCHGLAAAHDKQIVHRDMKPENIFITHVPSANGGVSFVPKLLDFGIAKVSGNDGDNNLTRTGMIFGTPFYMSPEQALGQGVDHRADIYAMGVILYEAFTGALPFEGESFMGILTKHITTEPTPPAQRAAEKSRSLPNGMEDIITRAMKKKREERFATMEEMLNALIVVYRGLVGPGMSAYMEAHTPPPELASRPYEVVSGQRHITPVPHQHVTPVPHRPGSHLHHPAPSGEHVRPGTGVGHNSAAQMAAARHDSAPYAPHSYAATDASAPMSHAAIAASGADKGSGSKLGFWIGLFAALIIAGGAVGFFVLAKNGTAPDGGPTTESPVAGQGGSEATEAPVAAGQGAGQKPDNNNAAGAGNGSEPGADDNPASGTPSSGTAGSGVNDGSGDGAQAGAGQDTAPGDSVTNAQAQPAVVLLDAKPKDAAVWQNDLFLGKTPINIRVQPGEPVTIVLRRRGFLDTEITLDGSQGKEVVMLERKPRRPGKNNPSSDKGDKPAPTPTEEPEGGTGDLGLGLE